MEWNTETKQAKQDRLSEWRKTFALIPRRVCTANGQNTWKWLEDIAVRKVYRESHVPFQEDTSENEYTTVEDAVADTLKNGTAKSTRVKRYRPGPPPDLNQQKGFPPPKPPPKRKI